MFAFHRGVRALSVVVCENEQVAEGDKRHSRRCRLRLVDGTFSTSFCDDTDVSCEATLCPLITNVFRAYGKLLLAE
jgi:hypothetical protein